MRIRNGKRGILAFFGVLLALVIGAAVAGGLWYSEAQKPVDSNDNSEVRVEIKSGMNSSQIAKALKEKRLIRDEKAFLIYLRLNGGAGDFKTGVFVLKRSQDMGSIIEHLASGKVDERSITFYPGGMLEDKSNTEPSKKTDVVTVLRGVGYSQSEIEKAMTANYQSPVLANRPDGAGIEGYIWGETYFMPTDATPEQVIKRAIDEFSTVIKKHDLEAKFKKQGLSLFEGITLASIVQKEVSCHGKQLCEDQKIVAQIFLKRLREDMPLGADATFMYAAKKDGVQASVDLDSPYNTRIHKGLTPGPISSPGLGALLAVAEPADTEYLYFVSGDDFTNHFAYTNEEHLENTRKYCHENCKLP